MRNIKNIVAHCTAGNQSKQLKTLKNGGKRGWDGNK
jgi:hypothetical protein